MSTESIVGSTVGPGADGHTFGLEEPAESATNDLLVAGAVRLLRERGVLRAGEAIDWAPYHRAVAVVEEHFVVERSSITTRMARLLYAVTRVQAPAAILCLGSAWGNALAWMAAAAPAADVLGVDLDTTALVGAAHNFARAGLAADWLAADARTLRPVAGGWDLVLLDVDDPVTGKDILAEVLPALAPRLAPGAVVLAHDACHPKFAGAFDRYRARLGPELGARTTMTVPVDRYGLEVTSCST